MKTIDWRRLVKDVRAAFSPGNLEDTCSVCCAPASRCTGRHSHKEVLAILVGRVNDQQIQIEALKRRLHKNKQ